jgi:hypothetical protein
VTLAGAQDTGNQSLVADGGSSFSTIPTIAEINASAGLNQVIGLVNRRMKNYNAAFGTTMTPLAYLTGTKIKAADFTAIKTAIDLVRTTEGFAAYGSWPANMTAGKLIKGVHLAHMRKALRISGVCTLAWYGCVYNRMDNPWLTYKPGSEAAISQPATSELAVGKMSGTYPTRARSTPQFALPEWFAAGESVTRTLKFNALKRDVSLEAFSMKLFQQVAATPDDFLKTLLGPGGYAYHRDTLLWTIASTDASLNYPGSTFTFSLDDTAMAARAGAALCFIVTTEAEYNGTGAAPVSIGSYGGTYAHSLVVDFGA